MQGWPLAGRGSNLSWPGSQPPGSHPVGRRRLLAGILGDWSPFEAAGARLSLQHCPIALTTMLQPRLLSGSETQREQTQTQGRPSGEQHPSGLLSHLSPSSQASSPGPLPWFGLLMSTGPGLKTLTHPNHSPASSLLPVALWIKIRLPNMAFKALHSFDFIYSSLINPPHATCNPERMLLPFSSPVTNSDAIGARQVV